MDKEKFLQLARENGSTQREAAIFCSIVLDAIEEEREECAKLCEKQDGVHDAIYAAAIRERSNV